MAQRGEILAARDLAARATAVRWNECIQKLVEAEKIVAQRLGKRSAWVLVDQAKNALAARKIDRCAELLAELSTAEPSNEEGRALASELVSRLEAAVDAASEQELRAHAQRLAKIRWEISTRAAESLSSRLGVGRRRRVAPGLVLRGASAVVGLTLLVIALRGVASVWLGACDAAVTALGAAILLARIAQRRVDEQKIAGLVWVVSLAPSIATLLALLALMARR
jgi:hypothetical protein